MYTAFSYGIRAEAGENMIFEMKIGVKIVIKIRASTCGGPGSIAKGNGMSILPFLRLLGKAHDVGTVIYVKCEMMVISALLVLVVLDTGWNSGRKQVDLGRNLFVR